MFELGFGSKSIFIASYEDINMQKKPGKVMTPKYVKSNLMSIKLNCQKRNLQKEIVVLIIFHCTEFFFFQITFIS